MFAFLYIKFAFIFQLPFFAKIGDACSLPDGNTNAFFFFPHWWKYLRGEIGPLGNCTPAIDLTKHPTDIWLIGLVVLDMLLRLAGFLAVVSIIIAGARLITAEGNPEKGVAARNRLTNSLIGLAIAVSATALVGFLGHELGGGGGNLPTAAADQNSINKLFNLIFVILGALAFLFIVIAGFRYIIQGDNPQKTAEARRQIAYAAAGLVLISLAAAIVNFVLGKL